MNGAGSQWNWRWVVGLIVAGLMIFTGQRALTLDGRVQVLENEKSYLIQQIQDIKDELKEMNKQLDRVEDKVNRIDRKTP